MPVGIWGVIEAIETNGGGRQGVHPSVPTSTGPISNGMPKGQALGLQLKRQNLLPTPV